ncbi:MAG: 50S ribosomal protein L20 [Rickettsiales bacterium]
MTRAITSTVTKERHRKMLKLAKGYRGRASTCYRIAKQKVEKGLQYAYRDRKKKKSVFRSDLWIIRINAALRERGLIYSKFMHMLKQANILINRKMLSELALNNPISFTKLVEYTVEKIKA